MLFATVTSDEWKIIVLTQHLNKSNFDAVLIHQKPILFRQLFFFYFCSLHKCLIPNEGLFGVVCLVILTKETSVIISLFFLHTWFFFFNQKF